MRIVSLDFTEFHPMLFLKKGMPVKVTPDTYKII